METLFKKRRKELSLRRYKEAYQKFKEAGNFLYQMGANKVYLFGSIVTPDRFTEHSDIDIAVKVFLLINVSQWKEIWKIF